LGDALGLAEQLVADLRRLLALEKDVHQLTATHLALAETARAGPGDEDLASLEALLAAWADRPNDLLVMVKIAEQARTLAGLAVTLRTIRRQLPA
jgi:hypothetical protein